MKKLINNKNFHPIYLKWTSNVAPNKKKDNFFFSPTSLCYTLTYVAYFHSLSFSFTSSLISWHFHFVNILNMSSMFIVFLLIGIGGGVSLSLYIYIYVSISLFCHFNYDQLQVRGEACHLDVYSNLKCGLIIENGCVT